MTLNKNDHSTTAFIKLALLTFISFLGSHMASFAGGLWAYQQSNSVSVYSLVLFAGMAPQFLFAPALGVWIDRYNKKYLLLIAQATQAACASCLILLYLNQSLQIWQLVAFSAIISVFSGLSKQTFQASVVFLVPKPKLAWAEGVFQGGVAISMILSPALSSFLYVLGEGLTYVLAIDLLTFLFSSMLLLALALPQLESRLDQTQKTPKTRNEVRFAWHYIRTNPSLLAMSLFLFVNSIIFGIGHAVFVPFALSFSTEKAAGFMISFSAIGMVASGMIMMKIKHKQQKINTMLLAYLFSGCSMLLYVVSPSIAIITAIATLSISGNFLGLGCSEVLWKQKVPATIQGRVFGLKTLLVMGGMPLGFFIAGPLTDTVEPLFLATGDLAQSWVASIVGVGPGRGIALVLASTGLVRIATTIIATYFAPLKNLETLIPDAASPEAKAAD